MQKVKNDSQNIKFRLFANNTTKAKEIAQMVGNSVRFIYYMYWLVPVRVPVRTLADIYRWSLKRFQLCHGIIFVENSTDAQPVCLLLKDDSLRCLLLTVKHCTARKLQLAYVRSLSLVDKNGL